MRRRKRHTSPCTASRRCRRASPRRGHLPTHNRPRPGNLRKFPSTSRRHKHQIHRRVIRHRISRRSHQHTLPKVLAVRRNPRPRNRPCPAIVIRNKANRPLHRKRPHQRSHAASARHQLHRIRSRNPRPTSCRTCTRARSVPRPHHLRGPRSRPTRVDRPIRLASHHRPNHHQQDHPKTAHMPSVRSAYTFVSLRKPT
jgi:hypothetical protein